MNAIRVGNGCNSNLDASEFNAPTSVGTNDVSPWRFCAIDIFPAFSELHHNCVANRLTSPRLHKPIVEVKIAASSLEQHIEEAGLLNCRAALDMSGDEHHVRNPKSKIAFDRYQLECKR
jgi:hypothetical protein